jgi:hypothetical protein
MHTNLTVLKYGDMLVICRWHWQAVSVTGKEDDIPNFEFVTRAVWVSELVPAWREMRRWATTSANNIMQIET